MEDQAPHLEALLNLDNRHDDLLKQLDDLDRQVADVLRLYRPPQEEPDTVISADPADPIC